MKTIIAIALIAILAVSVQQADASQRPAWTDDLLKFHASGLVTADEFRNAIAYVDSIHDNTVILSAYAQERELAMAQAQQANEDQFIQDHEERIEVTQEFRQLPPSNLSPLLQQDYTHIEITTGTAGEWRPDYGINNPPEAGYDSYESTLAPETQCIHEVQYDPIRCYELNYINGHSSYEYTMYMKGQLAYLYR
jgi:hypothetical protein